MGASTCCAEAEPDTRFTVFDLSALKKQCLISISQCLISKLRLMAVIEKHGLFQLRGAAQRLADMLNVSRASIYNYRASIRDDIHKLTPTTKKLNIAKS